MTRITNRQEYAIAMSYYFIEEPTKYNAYDHNTVRPGDICFTCLKPLVKDDVFRCLVVSQTEMYMEHEWHNPGVGHQRMLSNGSRVPY